MKHLSFYIKRNIPIYVLGIFSIIVYVVLDMFTPQITRSLVDNVILGEKLELLSKLLLGYLLVGVGRAIFVYIEQMTFDAACSKIATNVRGELFRHLQTLSANFFDKNNAGEIMSRVKDDIDSLWGSLGYVTQLLIEVSLHAGIILYCMFSMNWKLAIIPAVLMCGSGFIAVLMEKRLSCVYEEIDEEKSELNDCASENLAGVRTVKAFAREQFEISKFHKHNKKFYELNVKQSRVFVKYYPMFQVITVLLPLIVLLHGGYFVIHGTFTLGELSAFIQYSMNMTWPMEMLGWLMNEAGNGRAAYRRIKEYFAEEPQIKNAPDAITLSKINGDIDFKNVSFENNGSLILQDISFSIKHGETLGIMGATGSGKTSIINLLSRMYDVSSGSILIDGFDIRCLTTEQVRKNIATVSQEVFLFSSTVDENIRFGKKTVLNAENVTRALAQAEAKFVKDLPEKLDTIIGERGVGLSGGQKQRLTIARALAKNTPILVFDDSTSALDMETEQKLQRTIQEIEGVTKIIIAHRISSVRKADQIIVLRDGKIAERGTHEELLKLKKLYYQTWISQYGEFAEKLLTQE